jgi:hypothetical protein
MFEVGITRDQLRFSRESRSKNDRIGHREPVFDLHIGSCQRDRFIKWNQSGFVYLGCRGQSVPFSPLWGQATISPIS